MTKKIFSTSHLNSARFGFRAVTRAACLLAAVLGLQLVAPSPLGAVPVSVPSPRVLIMDETVLWGTNSLEALAAAAAIPGCAVDVCSATNWALIPQTGLGGPTGYGFDSYRAIIIGDPSCGTGSPGYLSALSALNGTKTTWTPVATGNVIIMGVDNVCHAYNKVGAAKTIDRGVAFAVNDTNRTGFYYAMSCYYDYDAPAVVPTLVPHLTGFGTFMTRNYGGVCFSNCHIVATHPIFTAAPPLTDLELTGWGCSTHEGFDVWPANFIVLAIALTNGTFTASDGSNGVPYMVVRGEGVHVISSISLDPPLATNNVGTTHTVCATLATNAFPKVNVAVTFTITAGPNSVTNFTALTDTNGVACFTYTGYGGPGIDYITASYRSGGDTLNTSDPVAKVWEGTCVGVGCENLDCLPDGTYSYQFCVTNLFADPMGAISLQNPPAGITITPSTVNLSPPVGPGQSTNVTVTVSAPLGTASVCFLLGAYPQNPVTLPCAIPHCVALPTCCNRVITNQLTYASASGLVSTYNYQITLQNITGSPVKYVAFGADQPCVSFLPPLVNLTLPAYGGPSLLFPAQTRTLNIQVQKTAPCPGTNTFHLSMMDSNGVACCSTRLTLPPAKCLGLALPYDGTVVLMGTPMLLRAIPIGPPISVGGPCGFGVVYFYQDATLVGVADSGPLGIGPYEVTVTPSQAGTYEFTAATTLSSGEVETSDPVTVTVLAPALHPEQHAHGNTPLSAVVKGGIIQLNLASSADQVYLVQSTTNLATGDWTTLNAFQGDGTVIVTTDSMTNAASRFYRAVSLH